MIEAAKAIHGSVTIPLLWIAVVLLLWLGIALARGGSRGIGAVVMVIGVVLLLSTPAGGHLKAGLSGLLNG